MGSALILKVKIYFSMPAGLDTIMSNYELLKKAWEGKKLQEVEKLLLALKIEFAVTQPANEREMLIMREVYEIGAQYSVAARDVPSFERYMSMLKSVYTDQCKTLRESSRMYELLGLNLLCLLSQNRLSDFHTELELLPPDILLGNPYIENPVQLEQFIMEGKYNKVIDTRYNVPAESSEKRNFYYLSEGPSTSIIDHWNVGEPNDIFGKEDCVTFLNFNQIEWADYDCNHHYFSICQEDEPCGSLHHANDNFCDDENNNARCNWDGGACCNNPYDKSWAFCTECACLDPTARGNCVDDESKDVCKECTKTKCQKKGTVCMEKCKKTCDLC